MRDVDGFAGAAGHELSDPRVRGIVERAVAGEAVDAALPGDEHIAFG